MPSIQEYQIVALLRVAREQLVYCEYIGLYPIKVGRRNFDTTGGIDQFYKNVYNVCFYDSLLILGSLLDDRDSRVISFWNWTEFKAKKADRLRDVMERFNKHQLKQIRDQLVAHIDIGNRNNNFPSFRRRGMVNEILVQRLTEILNDLIAEFKDYAKKYSTSYSAGVFEGRDALDEITAVMELAKPKMTDNIVI